MEFYNRHSSEAGFRVYIDRNPLKVPSSSSSPSSEEPTVVHIEFILETVHSYFRQPYCGGAQSRVRITAQDIIKTSSDFVDSGAFLSSSDGVHRLITRKLYRFGIDRKYYRQIADLVRKGGRRVLATGGCLCVEVKLVHEHIHDETQSETELVNGRRSSWSNEYGMVAASESSIKGLKRKRIAVAATDTDEEEEEEGGRKTAATACAVCLEKLPMGSEVTMMPCSHLFHSECITTWLRNSHCCPICRFKLPTAHETVLS